MKCYTGHKREKILPKCLIVVLIMTMVGFFSLTFYDPMDVNAEDASAETWIYINGQSGSDTNDGSSESSAVKSWDKATELLGEKSGGIIVCGAIRLAGRNNVINTPAPDKQIVKRTSAGMRMFIIESDASASFRDIVLDGEGISGDDGKAIMVSSGGTVNIYDGANFKNFLNLKNGSVIETVKAVTYINIYGGSFLNNGSAQGGAIYQPGRGEINIYAGEFINNSSTTYGGAIYQGDLGSSLNIYNAVFTGNTATRYGGAIETCATGIVNQLSVNGAAIYFNKAPRPSGPKDISRGPDIYTETARSADLGEQMLGGGVHLWDNDSNKGYESWPIQADINKALAVASTFFTGNSSRDGGAIRANGTVTIGMDSAALLFKKVDANNNEFISGATFTLSGNRASGGTFTDTQTDSDNDGIFIFKNIPAGTYTLTETASPTGYKAAANTWSVTVDANYNITASGDNLVQRSRDTDMYYLIKDEPKTVKVSDHLTVKKALTGRDWKDSDKFEFALIPQDNAPMPGNSKDTDGIKHADIEITNDDTADGAEAYKDSTGFGEITFSASDLKRSADGKIQDTVFVYHVRELMAVESGIARIPGVTYDDTRYEYRVTVGVDNNGDLVVKGKSLYKDDNEISSSSGTDMIVAEFKNVYDAKTTHYHMMAEKSYMVDGEGTSPEDGSFTFALKAIGSNASSTPMPSGTSGGIYETQNEGNRVEFTGDDGKGITFSYDELTKSKDEGGYGFTHDELEAGIDFEYEMYEIMSGDPTNNNDGEFKREHETEDDDSIYRTTETFDGTHHTRKITVKLVTLDDNTEELQVESHADDHKSDFYIDSNGDEHDLTDAEWKEEHHGTGGVPIFVNTVKHETIEKKADLNVTKTSNVKMARVGDVIDYTIEVKNTGNIASGSIFVVDNLPEGLEYVSDDSEGRVDGKQVTWITNVGAGDSVTITLTTRTNEKAAGRVINNVYIEGIINTLIEAECDEEVIISSPNEGNSDSVEDDDNTEEKKQKTSEMKQVVNTGDDSKVVIYIIEFLFSVIAFLTVMTIKRN